jgi:hypothetical protein
MPIASKCGFYDSIREAFSNGDMSKRHIKFDQPRNTSLHRVDEVIERSTDFAAVHESDVDAVDGSSTGT